GGGPRGVRGVGRADHEHQIAAVGHLLDGRLAVGGGVADVIGARTDDLRKALAQARQDRAGFIDRERRLRDVGDALGIVDLELVDVPLALHEHDPLGRLAHRAFALLVAVVTDEHDRVAVLGEAHRLAMDLRDEWTGRVDRVQAAYLRALAHAGRYPVGGEHAHRALRHFDLLFDEDRAALPQLLDDVLVVDDLLAHVHRSAVNLERAFDRLHGAIHARAVSA